MLACQFACVAGTSLNPKGNITTITDVLEITEGVVNTCPAVLHLASAATLKSEFSLSLCFFALRFAIMFSVLMCWEILKIETSSKPRENLFLAPGFVLHLKNTEILVTDIKCHFTSAMHVF